MEWTWQKACLYGLVGSISGVASTLLGYPMYAAPGGWILAGALSTACVYLVEQTPSGSRFGRLLGKRLPE